MRAREANTTMPSRAEYPRGATSGCIRCIWSATTWRILRTAAATPSLLPRPGRLKTSGIAAISVTRMIKKNNSQTGDTLAWERVSKPIGGGNSSTVSIRIAAMAPTTPIFDFGTVSSRRSRRLSARCLCLSPLMSYAMLLELETFGQSPAYVTPGHALGDPRQPVDLPSQDEVEDDEREDADYSDRGVGIGQKDTPR
jgi:hypothetical protein